MGSMAIAKICKEQLHLLGFVLAGHLFGMRGAVSPTRSLAAIILGGMAGALLAAAPGNVLVLFVVANMRPVFGTPSDDYPTVWSFAPRLIGTTAAGYLLWTGALVVLLDALSRKRRDRGLASAIKNVCLVIFTLDIRHRGKVGGEPSGSLRDVVVAASAFPVAFVFVQFWRMWAACAVAVIWGWDLFGRTFSNGRGIVYLRGVLPWALLATGLLMLFMGLRNAVRVLHRSDRAKLVDSPYQCDAGGNAANQWD
jgi:hypothetical protein